MGNCLVTKLKGVVDNDNLDKLGHITLSLQSESNKYLQIRAYRSDSPINITMLEGTIDTVNSGGTKIDSTHATITGTTGFPGINTPNTSQKVVIDVENYYNLQIIGALTSSKNVSKLKYANLLNIRVNPQSEDKFDVSEIRDLNLVPEVSLTNNGRADYLYGSLSFLSNFSNLTSFKLTDLTYGYRDLDFSPEYIKDLKSLTTLILDNLNMSSMGPENKTIADFYGKLTNLTTLRLQGTPSRGTIEEFVAAQISNGRDTCDGIVIGANMGLVTYEGNIIAGTSAKTLSWTSANDITIA